MAIAAAGSILISIAIDQFMEIQMARQKLNSVLELAKQPADLNALLAAPDGRASVHVLVKDHRCNFAARSGNQLTASALAAAKSAKYQLTPSQ
jgi:hypothetical protein